MTPQLENGFTRIADAVLENIAKAKLNGTQFRILMIVWRSTYGWNKKSYALSESYLAEATGIHKQQIKRELKSMLEMGILTETKAPTFNTPREIQFNKRYLDSSEVAKTIPHSELDTPTGSELDTSRGSGLDTQKRDIKRQSNKQYKELYFDYEPLQKIFLEFIDHRKSIKQGMSAIAIKAAVNKINKFNCSNEEKVKAIESSIINNWKGIFEPKSASQSIDVTAADF
jgi:phage replication O-like protein O